MCMAEQVMGSILKIQNNICERIGVPEYSTGGLDKLDLSHESV